MPLRILSVVLGLMVAAPASFAACPTNQLRAGPLTAISSQPKDSLKFDNSYIQYAFAHYDVPAGTLGMEFGELPTRPNGAIVVVEDDFRVIGVPDGAIVPLTAHMVVTFFAVTQPEIGSYVQAHLSDAFGQDVTVGNPAQINGTYDLALPVQAIGGQTFRLRFDVRGFSSANPGYADATFMFTEIPLGAAVTSCQGYSSSPPVATRRSTWGRLRAAYR